MSQNPCLACFSKSTEVVHIDCAYTGDKMDYMKNCLKPVIKALKIDRILSEDDRKEYAKIFYKCLERM